MSTPWRPFASYNLWLQFAPPVGQECWHCDMKRGFTKARYREPLVKALLATDTIPQRIGLLAQRGVYEFHRDPLILHQDDAVTKVVEILQLNLESEIIQKRVMSILKNYHLNPILSTKKIIKLSRGDEGFPEPILVEQDRYQFHLFAAIDCIFEEQNSTLHILDFKTGQTNFDKRQAYVYLLAANLLYPAQPTVASFYNLESEKWSDPITATASQLNAFRIELAKISKQHQKDLQRYKHSPSEFKQIFPPNPGIHCQHCPFHSICEFSNIEVSP